MKNGHWGQSPVSIQSLPKGARVEVLLHGECWMMIRHNKKTGYVMSRYLKFLQ